MPDDLTGDLSGDPADDMSTRMYAAIAEPADYDSASFARIETGAVDPTVGVLLRMARAAGVTQPRRVDVAPNTKLVGSSPAPFVQTSGGAGDRRPQGGHLVDGVGGRGPG